VNSALEIKMKWSNGMKIVAILLVVLLSGCATTKNSYIPPKPENNNTATIISSWTRNGLVDWEGYSIEAIDDKYVSYGLSDRDWVTFPITEGPHKLLVFGQYNRSFSGTCPQEKGTHLFSMARKGNKQHVSWGECNEAQQF
jgi:uncharacterized protein YceK